MPTPLKTQQATIMECYGTLQVTCPWCKTSLSFASTPSNMYAHTCSEHLNESTFLLNGTMITGVAEYLAAERRAPGGGGNERPV